MVPNSEHSALPALGCETLCLGPSSLCMQLFELTFDLSVHDMFLAWGAGAAVYRVPDKVHGCPV